MKKLRDSGTSGRSKEGDTFLTRSGRCGRSRSVKEEIARLGKRAGSLSSKRRCCTFAAGYSASRRFARTGCARIANKRKPFFLIHRFPEYEAWLDRARASACVATTRPSEYIPLKTLIERACAALRCDASSTCEEEEEEEEVEEEEGESGDNAAATHRCFSDDGETAEIYSNQKKLTFSTKIT